MPAQVIDTELQGVKIVVPRRIDDARGSFAELWNARDFQAAGIEARFVQDNYTLNLHKHVVRGLHYQVAPAMQGKLVRVASGAIMDVVVDVRAGSPTFGRHVSVILSGENWRQVWIPSGFAHGYCTLVSDSEVHYKVTDFYSPDHDRGIAWNDPVLGISWPVAEDVALLSERDRRNPRLADQPELCPYPS